MEIHFTVANSGSRPHAVPLPAPGYDEGWSEDRTERSTVYENLRPGRYRFQVFASNGEGAWDPRGASVAFSIEPHFYETAPFYIACALAFFGALGVIVRARTRASRATPRSWRTRWRSGRSS